MLKLSARTWSTLDIPSTRAAIQPDDVFGLGWLEAGVARIEWLPGGIRLSFGPYVGRIVIPGLLSIDIHELVPNTVAALFSLTAGTAKIASQSTTRGRTPLPPWVPFAARFGTGLGDYARTGLDRRYLPRETDSAFARGRVRVGATLRRHRARGRGDALSCLVRELSDDSPLNQALLVAGAKAERLLRTAESPSELRTLRIALRVFGGVSLDAGVDLDAARQLAASASRPVSPELLNLAEVLIRGITAESDERQEGQPMSAWINVDSLFERAVRETLAELLPPGSVRHGREDGVQLLRTGESLGAEPDVVVHREGRRLLYDAKYRRDGSNVGRSEIYQLMAHADAYGADGATLVTPRVSDADADRFLGRDSRGCPYRVVVVDAADSAALQGRLRQVFNAEAR